MRSGLTREQLLEIDKQERFIQIMPAPNWWAQFKNEDGSFGYVRGACWALQADGEIKFIEASSDLFLSPSNDASNFVRIVYSKRDLSNYIHDVAEGK